MVYIKKPLIRENNFKIKEKLKEHFDVFFNKKRKNDIFPIIKSVKIEETSNNIIYCVVEYNKATVANKDGKEEKGVVFYTNKRVVEKENIKFKLPIGKNFTYMELSDKKGLTLV